MGRSHRAVVLESAASYRRGLEAALAEVGFASGSEDDGDVLLVPLRAPADCGRAEAFRDRVVVALLPDAEPRSFSHALHHGAAGAIAWEEDPVRIAEVAAAAVAGMMLVPTATALGMANWGPDPHGDGPAVTDDEVAWLLELAKGGTVVHLADAYGYSERAMFRKLADLYARLGVTGRAEALLAAHRLGLLDG